MLFDFLKPKKSIVHKIPEDGKDNRTLTDKIWGWFKILVVLYLMAVHFLAALYLTDSHLVTRIETAPKIVSPLQGN